MKLRSIVLFGAGVAAGLAIANRLHEDEPEIQHGPVRTQGAADPAMRLVSDRASRLADRATVASLDVIRRARVAIRERLGEDAYDDAAWG
jgi:hypothetical protein